MIARGGFSDEVKLEDVLGSEHTIGIAHHNSASGYYIADYYLSDVMDFVGLRSAGGQWLLQDQFPSFVGRNKELASLWSDTRQMVTKRHVEALKLISQDKSPLTAAVTYLNFSEKYKPLEDQTKVIFTFPAPFPNNIFLARAWVHEALGPAGLCAIDAALKTDKSATLPDEYAGLALIPKAGEQVECSRPTFDPRRHMRLYDIFDKNTRDVAVSVAAENAPEVGEILNKLLAHANDGDPSAYTPSFTLDPPVDTDTLIKVVSEGGSLRAEVTVRDPHAIAAVGGLLWLYNGSAQGSALRCERPPQHLKPASFVTFKCKSAPNTDVRQQVASLAFVAESLHITRFPHLARARYEDYNSRRLDVWLVRGMTTSCSDSDWGPRRADARAAIVYCASDPSNNVAKSLKPIGDAWQLDAGDVSRLACEDLGAATYGVILPAAQAQKLTLQSVASAIDQATETHFPWGWIAGGLVLLGLGAAAFVVLRRLRGPKVPRPDPSFKPVTNVYIVGNPIRDPGMFFGRANELERIRAWIFGGSYKIILARGERRTGKTSLLYQVAGKDVEDQAVAVMLDFHRICAQIRNDDDVTRLIRAAILACPTFKDAGLPNHGDLLDFIETCTSHIAPRKLVFLCDEFESIEEVLNKGIVSPEGMAWFPAASGLPCAFVLSGSKAVNLRRWPRLKSLYQPIELSLLSREDTANLIRKPVQGVLTYDDAAVESIYRLSGGHPFYTQYICQNIIFHINQTARRYKIVAADLDAVVSFVVNNPHGHIVETWRAFGVGRWYRSVLVSLAHTLNTRDAWGAVADIVSTGQARGFDVDSNVVDGALAELLTANYVVERDERHRYRFLQDILRHYLRYHFQTVADVHLELGETRVQKSQILSGRHLAGGLGGNGSETPQSDKAGDGSRSSKVSGRPSGLSSPSVLQRGGGGAAKTRRRVAVAVVVLIVVAAAAAVRWRLLRGSDPAPAEPATDVHSPAAPPAAEVKKMPVADQPKPSSKSSEAATAYAAAMLSFRDGYSYRPAKQLKEAVDKDREVAAAWLRLAMLDPWGEDAEGLRGYAEKAEKYQGSLSQRDAVVLGVVRKMLTGEKRDLESAVEALRKLVHDTPGDAEAQYFLAMVLFNKADYQGVYDAAQSALDADPQFARALGLQADALAYMGKKEDAHAKVKACLELNPNATDCLATRLVLDTQEGDCFRVEIDARKSLTVESSSEYASDALASVLAMRGASSAAVEEALRPKWDALPEEKREATAQYDRALDELFRGELGRAVRTLRKLKATLEAAKARKELRRAMLLLAETLEETGNVAAAKDLASDYLAIAEVFSPPTHVEDYAIMSDATPRMLAIRRASEGVTDEAAKHTFFAERDQWLEEWKARTTPENYGYLWLQAYAGTATTAEDATAAMVALKQFGGNVPRFLPETMADMNLGRLYLLAAETDQAARHLERATHNCGGLRFPIQQTRAFLLLGEVMESKKEPAKACEAYRAVLRRWGSARRSVTAAAARERAEALTCEEEP